MALIGMAVFDTEENRRTDLTRRTLECLQDTVDLRRHTVVVVDNSSCGLTRSLLSRLSLDYLVIWNEKNLGTAKAINQAWKLRRPGEHCCKIDNDIIVHEPGWLDLLEECLARDPKIGIVGLKRKDRFESPLLLADNPFRSTLRMLPHEAGQRWLVVEESADVMGSCVLHSSALIDKVGYLWQPGLYGWEDCLMAVRAQVAGYSTCYYPHILIDHIDPSDTPYETWKRDHSGALMDRFNELKAEYRNGTRSVCHEA